MKRLWTVVWNPGNQSVIPEPRLCPEFPEESVIVADQFSIIVEIEFNELEAILRDYPYWRLAGHPADGRHIGEGGDEVYIHDATVLNTEEELWEAMGLKPADFGGEIWDDVDDDVVRDCVPAF